MSENQVFGLIVAGWLAASAYWFVVCGWVAAEKSRHQWGWAIAGFLIWFGAFLPLLAAPDLSEYE